eukprot:CAMPEP_0172439146 /NCGR_PEP_ID=MMETSP1065-20121228/219_1 /TAXON_ID=265537 /ORGANISM="Amphiprora paludosa, Strain CCMP125" /LENGTH=1241 /DNA_ID=CAMNT_0013187787 /DNA_START=100 /DNA_END=3825 /DNA_ORIENTATION=-
MSQPPTPPPNSQHLPPNAAQAVPPGGAAPGYPQPQQHAHVQPHQHHGGGRGGGGVYNPNLMTSGAAARGGYPPQQQQPQAYHGGRSGGGAMRHSNNMGSWQPTQAGGGAAAGGAPTYPPQMNMAGRTYAGAQQQQAYYGGGYGGMAPAAAGYGGSWQPATPYNPSSMRGGVFYPPGAGTTPTTPATTQPANFAPPPERKKKPLLITDKDGNVIDLGAAQSKKAAPAPATAAPPSDAGAKMRQMALESLKGGPSAEEKKKKQQQQQQEAEAAQKKKLEEEEAAAAAKKKAEEEEAAAAAAKEAAQKKAQEEAAAEAAAKKKAEEEEEEAQKKAAEKEASTPKLSSLAAALQAEDASSSAAAQRANGGRLVYPKAELLRFKAEIDCQEKPEGMPDMTIVKGPSRGRSGGRRDPQRQSGSDRGGGGGGGGDDSWKRGGEPPRRPSSKSNNNDGGKDSWARGQAMPPPKPNQNNNNNNNRDNQRGGRGGRGGRGNNQPPLYDGPVAPLVKSANHWRPQADTNAMVKTEKAVKSVLNKMTKEKFERLAQQMVEIPLLSYDMLTMMIENVYDKAIDEPSFGDIYADLCVRLSVSAASAATSFVRIIESDEEPPTEGDVGGSTTAGEASHNTVYRWSNDVSATDAEIVGPFESEEACRVVAVDQNNAPAPSPREEMELEIVSVSIRQGMFIKVMKKKQPTEEDGDKIYYTVFFPVSEAAECGQQMSESIFLSEPEAKSDATKKNSFKRSLLNKCEEEFNKQDIYKEWKDEKSKYESSKSAMTDRERAEKEEDLGFRRIRIKKQMLGNIKFIGQLFKKNLLKEKIMRYCIASLLKLEELQIKSKNPEYKDTGDLDMDEEDHEAICSMFTTIGSTIDKPASATFMAVCFNKISDLATDKNLPSRSRFMYKDLIDLRKNNWVPRRKEEKAKTLEEIRKDVEREERKQAEQSMRENNQRGQSFRGGNNNRDNRDNRGGSGDYRNQGGYNNNNNRANSSMRPRPAKPAQTTDDDGFTTIAGKGAAPSTSSRGKGGSSAPPPVTTKPSAFDALADRGTSTGSVNQKAGKPLDDEAFARRLKSIRTDFIGDGGNVDELKLSIEELFATPDYGSKLVSQYADQMVDCREPERVAIVKILGICAEKKWISSSDAKTGLTDPIEFVDATVFDAPNVYEYLGDILVHMLRIGLVDVAWICEASMKVQDKKAPFLLVKATIKQMKAAGQGALAKDKFGAAKAPLVKAMGEDDWRTLSKDL